MIAITGSTRKATFVHQLQLHGWGRMFVTDKPTPYDGEPWGFDNGAFAAWSHKEPWDADAYAKRLDRAHAIGRPYMAVLPDIVGGGKSSLDLSLDWMNDRVPVDWPWYLAVQDGMTFQDVANALTPGIVGIFLGGTNAFKQQAKDWCEFTHRRGLRFHYARAGIEWKIQHAMRVGSDSLDSAFPLWEVRRFDEFIALLETGRSRSSRNGQICLFNEEEQP